MASIYVRSSSPQVFNDCARQPKRLEPTLPAYIIEPVPQRFQKFLDSERYRDDPDFHLFDNYVVGTEEGPTVLNLADHAPELASVHNFSEEIFHAWPSRSKQWKFTGTKDVERIRLDNFITDNNISTLEYLRADGCQGNHLDVLKSLGDKIDMVQAGFCKGDWLTSIYDNPNNHTLVISKFLIDNGFIVEIIPDGNRLPFSFTGVKSPRNHPVAGMEASIHFKRRLLKGEWRHNRFRRGEK